MADPLTLAALGAVAITEGIKFLYGQATEFIKNRRERKSESLKISLPTHEDTLYQGHPKSIELDSQNLEACEAELLALRQCLSNHVDGLVTVDLKDTGLLQTVDTLREMIEVLSGTPVVFPGENRALSETLIEGNASADRVDGILKGVRASLDHLPVGVTIRGIAKAKVVGSTGEVIGLDIEIEN